MRRALLTLCVFVFLYSSTIGGFTTVVDDASRDVLEYVKIITFLLAAISGSILFFLPFQAGLDDPVIKKPPLQFLFRVTDTVFSAKDKAEIWQPLFADWQDEYFEAMRQNQVWKMRWINFRYVYAFGTVLVRKSPIGDLIGFVIKIAN